ncbi:T9SS type A sorting domain-containing protein [Saprospiraceae bacterium]|nr:T9SS type A sorting domain-containing protein [Saprospiraceae bacterium]
MINNSLLRTGIYLYIFCISLVVNQSHAQAVLSPAGSSYSNSEFSIEWTIGEMNISTQNISSNIFLTQGFNQPLLICEPCENNLENDPLTESLIKKERIIQSTDISIYPNPTSDIINIELELDIESQVYIAIYNIAGRMLRLESLSGSNSTTFNTSINVSEYAVGLYYLRIFNNNISETLSFEKL